MRKYKRLGLIAILLLILLFGLCRSVRLFWLVRSATSFPLNLKWQIDLGSSTYDLPAYQDGLVVLPANSSLSSYWYGIEATTGQIVWSQMAWIQRLGFRNYRRCLTEEYLVVSGPWSLLVFNLQTGEIGWTKKTAADRAACSEDMIFVIGSRGFLVAGDISTGQGQWTGTNPQKPFNGLTFNFEARELIASEAIAPEGLYIVDPESGILLRSFKEADIPPTNRNWERGPMYLVDQGQLFIGGTVLDARNGQVIHKEDRFHSFVPPTVTTDSMYLSDPVNGIVALDRTTFEVNWQYHPSDKFQEVSLSPISPVAVLDGIGYVIFSDVTLRAFDLRSGQELGYWQPGWFDLWQSPLCNVPVPIPGCSLSARAGLATSEDTLFVSFGDGKLYAFGKE